MCQVRKSALRATSILRAVVRALFYQMREASVPDFAACRRHRPNRGMKLATVEKRGQMRVWLTTKFLDYARGRA